MNGGDVTAGNAMQIAAHFACVRVVSESVAMLPLTLIETNGRMRQRAVNHPLYGLLHDMPNPEMSSVDFRMALQGHLSGWGNGYAQIVYDNAGRRKELWPLRPDRMTVGRSPSGELIYPYTTEDNRKVIFQWWEILHLRGLSFDGLVGYSPVGVARRAYTSKLRKEEFEENFYANSARPDVALKTTGTLSDEAYNRLMADWEERHRGSGNAGRTAILEDGLDVVTIGIPQADAQYLDSQRMGRQEIASLHRVPPHMIGDMDRATFGNAEEMNQEFVDYCLGIWLRIWEQGINRALLTAAERKQFSAKFMVQGLLRGNHASRAQFYRELWMLGAFNSNDIRELEDLNPVEGGDVNYVPMNMMPLTLAANGQAMEPPGDIVAARSFRPVAFDVARRLARRLANDVTTSGPKIMRKADWDTDALRTWFVSHLAGQRAAIAEMVQPLLLAVGQDEPTSETAVAALMSVALRSANADSVDEMAAALEAAGHEMATALMALIGE